MRLLIPLIVLLGPAWSFASELGFARSTSQLESERRPGEYRPFNLFDGDPATVWCEGARGDGVGERVLVGFKERVTIDEVRVGNGDARAAFTKHHRVQRLALNEETSRRTIELADERKSQVIKLSKPLETDRLEIEVLEVYEGEGADDAACLSDVVFYSSGRPLTSAAGLPKPDRATAALMGPWYAGPEGARDRFLTFFADQTFEYALRPLDPDEKAEELRGGYDFDGKRLKLKPLGLDSSELDALWVKGKDRTDSPLTNLVLSGDALEGALSREWSQKP